MISGEKLKQFVREAAILACLLVAFVVFLFLVAAKFLFQNVAYKENPLDFVFSLENVIGTSVALLIVIVLVVPVYLIIRKRSR